MLAGWLVPLGVGLGLFVTPEPCFPYSTRLDNLVLASDRPFAPEDGQAVLREVRAKLQASPLYRPGRVQRAFICNEPGHYAYFFNRAVGAAGIARAPFSAVFLRRASVKRNRLYSNAGELVPPPRDLAYYIAHEFTHDLCGARVGLVRYYTLPVWVREGVAEYVALEGKPAAGHYDVYMRKVAERLEHLTLDQLLARPL